MILRALFIAATVAAFAPESAFALGDTVEAGSCSIANSATATGNTVTCNFNMPPENLKALVEAAAKGGEAPLLDSLVSKTLGVTEDAAKKLLSDRRPRREHSRRQAGRSLEQDRGRL
jgi:hypothetical protein